MTAEDSLPLEEDTAASLMESGRAAEAVPLYRKRVVDHPNEDSHLLGLAWALHDSGHAAEAAACLEELFQKELTRKPFTGFAYDELVRIYRESKNEKALISVCERSAAARPEDVGILRTLGEAYLAAGRTGEAASLFERLAGREPDGSEWWSLLGDAQLQAGNLNRAEAAYRRASEIDPDSEARFFGRLAEGLLKAGCPARSKSAWEQCLKTRPEEPVFWMGLGDALVRLEETAAAADSYGRAAALLPASAGSCWHRLGNLLEAEGFHDRAAEAFEKASQAEPGNRRHLLRLASAHAAQGRHDLAAAALERMDEKSSAGDEPPAVRNPLTS
jgi:tetratricopeptide (TPR) repeat protein